MAVVNFVPELWTARLLVSLRKNAVATRLVNRDYEGEIRRQGDKVNITTISDVTIGNYVSHTPITVGDIDDTTKQLIIDVAKYFAIELDDIERAQQVAGGDALGQAVDNAAYQLKDGADSYLLGELNAGVLAGTNDLSTTVVTADGAMYDTLVDLSVALDESNVPDNGRFVVVEPAVHGLLLKDDRFISAGDDAGAAARANGRIGQAAGLEVFKSNNLPAPTGAEVTAGASGKVVLAGYRGAATFAEQIVEVEAMRMEKQFADMVRGLHVYGSLVTRPTGLARAALDTTA